jgi:hypothetical protein
VLSKEGRQRPGSAEEHFMGLWKFKKYSDAGDGDLLYSLDEQPRFLDTFLRTLTPELDGASLGGQSS